MRRLRDAYPLPHIMADEPKDKHMRLVSSLSVSSKFVDLASEKVSAV